jgi:hypothetical protein
MSKLLRLRPVAAVVTRVHFFIGRVLGTGDFEAEQAYLEERVEVDEGQGLERWRRVEELGRAGPNDRVYVLEPDTGTIRFGDGRHGRRPAPGARIRATYRLGAGDRD